MPNLLKDLEIDRVDLVDEGSNSAAFVELYKKKGEMEDMNLKDIISKMKTEHAEVVEAELAKATEAVESLAKANETIAELQGANSALTDELSKAREENEVLKAKQCENEEAAKGAGDATSFDEEEVLKSLPEPAREYILKMKAQKEAAEEEIRKGKETELHNQAVAKAATLKSLPIEHDKLVELVKTATPEVLDLLESANTAIDTTVLGEVGKSKQDSASSANAWDKIEKAADDVMKSSDFTGSRQQAIAIVIKTKPELYKEYLGEHQGGAK